MAWISCSWVSLQLLLMIVVNPPGPCSSSTGSASASGDPVAGQRRSDGPQDHLLGRASREDEAADANLIARPHEHAGREVDRLRRRRAPGVGAPAAQKRTVKPSRSLLPSGCGVAVACRRCRCRRAWSRRWCRCRARPPWPKTCIVFSSVAPFVPASQPDRESRRYRPGSCAARC